MKARPCAECGERFQTKQAKQLFCCDKCRNTFHNRMAKRGKVLAPLVMAYRVKRGGETAKSAHVDFCRLVADFNEEDKAVGRMSAHAFITHQYKHWLRA